MAVSFSNAGVVAAQAYLAEMLKAQEAATQAAAKEAADIDALYTKYYAMASSGNVASIPTDALQNMGKDENCSSEAYNYIASELAVRGTSVDPEADAIDALYTKYYDMACNGDVSSIPTEALQNMGMDENCADGAFDYIKAELDKRGEPVERVSDVEALYTEYYEMACNNDVSTIPTEALQNMAMDENCSILAYNNIFEELQFRDEPIDPNDPDGENLYDFDSFL